MQPLNLGKFALCAVLVAAAGCTVSNANGGLRTQLGLAATPDEFLIIARDPIEVPVSFDLQRPQPGAPSRVEVDPIADAHTALFRTPAPTRLAVASDGERVLLSGADADGDNSAIRAELTGGDIETGERQYGLTTILGVPVPATLDQLEDGLDGVDETIALRDRGLPVPAAPPPPENRNTGIRYLGP